MARTAKTGFSEKEGSARFGTGAAAKSRRIELRTTAETKLLLQRAAAAAGKTVTEFVLDAGLGAAERTLLDRRLFRLEPAAWDEFCRALDRPVTSKPQLAKLLSEKSVLE